MRSAANNPAKDALKLTFADFLILISLSHLSDGKESKQGAWLPKDREARRAAFRLLAHSRNRHRCGLSEPPRPEQT